MKLFGRKNKPIIPPQADVLTVQLPSLPPPVVDTAMATHIGTRAYQQDAVFVSPPVENADEMAFAVLCDGMGGMADGEAASSEVVSFMANAISAMPPAAASVPAYLTQAVHSANEMLLAFNHKNGTEAGTTLCVAVILGGQLFWASVGDSRIYILRGGEMARLTRDHNFAIHLQRMVENGQITQREADSDPRREALVSYIGAPVLEELDLNPSPFPLQSGDLLLLCSDGLTKSLPDEAIRQLLAEYGAQPRQAAPLLTGAAFDNGDGEKDNTSVILMRYQAPEPGHEISEPIQTRQNLRSEENESGEM